jgi:nucleoside triphosphate diphosphatase
MTQISHDAKHVSSASKAMAHMDKSAVMLAFEARAKAGDITSLLEVMQALRDPETGCPWDAKQTYTTIAPYTIEEAFEVAEAIAENDPTALRDELGDLLLQVVFHSRIAEEAKHFSFNDVIHTIVAKMARRHPHVFGTMAREDFTSDVWNDIKENEKVKQKHDDSENIFSPPSILENVKSGLPALMRAQNIQSVVAKVGFDWGEIGPVMDKIREELAEVEAASRDQEAPARVKEEIGDLLFAVVNLARHSGIDAETALREANAKFMRRFAGVEEQLHKEGRTLAQASLEEMENAWKDVKKQEKAPSPLAKT